MGSPCHCGMFPYLLCHYSFFLTSDIPSSRSLLLNLSTRMLPQFMVQSEFLPCIQVRVASGNSEGLTF